MKILRRGGLAALVAVAALAIPGVASAASVAPTQLSGNPGCTDINAGWSEFKIDRGNVEAGTYGNGEISVTVTKITGGPDPFDWSANRSVDAVIVKGGTDSNVYVYDPESYGDTQLVPPPTGGTSHVAFCYDAGDRQRTCAELHAGEADTDGDGIVDACDNCPATANADQMDSNGNGIGDACEQGGSPTCAELHAGEADSDGDGIVDACDNCPTTANADQADSDGDRIGDACDSQPQTPNLPPSGTAGTQQGPGGQAVLGESVLSPTARLLARSGCVGKTFTARVRGRGIASVVFLLDGKRVKTVRGGSAKLRINPNKFSIGVHRLVAVVRFTASSRTAPRRLVRSFQRCARALQAPRFTG